MSVVGGRLCPRLIVEEVLTFFARAAFSVVLATASELLLVLVHRQAAAGVAIALAAVLTNGQRDY